MSILATITERADAAALPFLVIGGNAVIAYGYPRQTQDFDLLVCESDRRAWDALIVALGYHPHHIHRVFHMYNATTTSLPPVDLMLVDRRTFDRLSDGARGVEIGTASVRVPALAHLIALKLHALRHGGEHRRAADLTDVVELVRLNEVNLASPEYREILERYASADTRRDLAVLLPRAFGLDPPDS